MSQTEKIIHEDVFSDYPICNEWRMRVRVTTKWDELDVECFALNIDLRCLNCGFHKHFWSDGVIDIEDIFYLCGSDSHYIAEVLADRERRKQHKTS